MIQAQILVGDLRRRVTWGHQLFFTSNSRFKRARGVGVVSLCLSRHDASTAIQNDPFWSLWAFTWPLAKVKCWPDILRSSCICFDAPWREEDDGHMNMPLGFLVQKLFTKIIIAKKAFFWQKWLGKFWRHISEEHFKSYWVLFRGFLLIIISEMMTHFRSNITFR